MLVLQYIFCSLRQTHRTRETSDIYSLLIFVNSMDFWCFGCVWCFLFVNKPKLPKVPRTEVFSFLFPFLFFLREVVTVDSESFAASLDINSAYLFPTHVIFDSIMELKNKFF